MYLLEINIFCLIFFLSADRIVDILGVWLISCQSAPFLCTPANAIAYTCGRIAGRRSLAVYVMQLVGATTVQAAVEKEAKGLPLGKTYTEVDQCLMKSSGKFKLAGGMRDEC